MSIFTHESVAHFVQQGAEADSVMARARRSMLVESRLAFRLAARFARLVRDLRRVVTLRRCRAGTVAHFTIRTESDPTIEIPLVMIAVT